MSLDACGCVNAQPLPQYYSTVSGTLPGLVLVSLCHHGKKLQATQHASAAQKGSKRDHLPAGGFSEDRHEPSSCFFQAAQKKKHPLAQDSALHLTSNLS